MNKIFITILVLSIAGCTTTQNANVNPATEMTFATGNNKVAALVAKDASNEVYELMNKAKREVVAGETVKVLKDYINPVIETFEQEYKSNYTNMVAPRTGSESMLYVMEGLLETASKDDKEKQSNIYRIPYVFAEAYYIRGSLNITLGKMDVAKKALEEAVALAPYNSFFLSELGHIYQSENRHEKALDIYKKSIRGADLAPDNLKTSEKTRALRGAGYSLIELNRLDEAVEKYNQVLEINPLDGSSLNELEYIKRKRGDSLF